MLQRKVYEFEAMVFHNICRINLSLNPKANTDNLLSENETKYQICLGHCRYASRKGFVYDNNRPKIKIVLIKLWCIRYAIH